MRPTRRTLSYEYLKKNQNDRFYFKLRYDDEEISVKIDQKSLNFPSSVWSRDQLDV